MKKINVEVIEKQDLSDMCNLAHYTSGRGLYLWKGCGQLVWHDGTTVSLIWLDMNFCDCIEDIPDDVPVDEFPDTVDQVIESGPAMVSEDLLLKAIAVVGDPSLITDLIDKGD